MRDEGSLSRWWEAGKGVVWGAVTNQYGILEMKFTSSSCIVDQNWSSLSDQGHTDTP